MKHPFKISFAVLVLALGIARAPTPDARPFHGGAASPPSPVSGQIAPFSVYNSSGSSVVNQQVTFEQPFQRGDIPVGNKIQIRKNDGVTVVATQEDSCSTWLQDTSRKACAISFVEPDTIAANSSVTYQVWAVPGAPNNTPNVSTANITANTDWKIQTSDLTEANGTTEPGTFDLISLNYVLTNCSQYNGTTGYGANPKCGWDITDTGPSRFGIHAFQYASSGGAFHKWLRTDMYIDFWGSGSTPCPCSVTARTSQPNSFGPISGGTIGPTAEPGYYFSAKIVNGANTIANLGGSNDSRTGSVTFNSTTGNVTFSGGAASWVERAAGPFGVKFTGTVPTGLTAGVPYYFYAQGANPFGPTASYQFYTQQCMLNNGATCASSPSSFSDNGSGVTATPVINTTPWAGVLYMDITAQRYWTNSAGALTSSKIIQVNHDFNYLTQKTKATLPFLASANGTALFNNLRSYGQIMDYYPGAYYYPLDMNQTGDGAGDERVGYINHSSVYTLYMPTDRAAYIGSNSLAASIGRMHMYHVNELTGMPDIFNNTTYPTFGTPQPTTHTYPFSGGAWLTPDTTTVNWDAYYERYTVWVDPSHFPMPQQGPLLKTGLPEWRDQMEQEVNSMAGQFEFASGVVNGVTYYRVAGAQLNDSQTRGHAWYIRTLDITDYYEPDAAPMKAYLHDLVAGNYNYLANYVTFSASAAIKSLGYYWADFNGRAGVQTSYQWWQDDFLFTTLAMQDWRGEYNNGFLETHFWKHVIGRMDGAGTVGGAGCLWAGPSRSIEPASTPGTLSTIATTWNGFFTNTLAAFGPTGVSNWPNVSWTNCAAINGGTGFINDSAPAPSGPNPSGPVSLYNDMAGSAALWSILGNANGTSLYNTIRDMEYHGTGCSICSPPLNFITYTSSGITGSYPEFAFGPLGAVN